MKIKQFYCPRTNFTKNAHRHITQVNPSLVLTRFRKTLFILLHQLLFNPASQIVFYGRCGLRFLRWRRLAHSLRTQFCLWHLFIVLIELFSGNFLWKGQNQKMDNLWYTRKLKKTEIKLKMQRWSALLLIFLASVKKFAKDSGICKERKDWNTGIKQKKGGIWVVLIWKRPRIRPPFFFFAFHGSYHLKWARVAYFPRTDSLKINHSVKTPWHRVSMGVAERSK